MKSLFGRPFFCLLGLLCTVHPALAELQLADVFSDHMVLQRGKVIPVWGQADAGQKVVVQFGDREKETVADAGGDWNVTLGAMPASADGRELQVSSGQESVVLKDVLLGDVWIATGQSNMQWMLKQSKGGKEAIAASEDAGLRLLNHRGTLHPGGKKFAVDFLKNMTMENYYASSGWQPCAPASSASFSGVAYFFGQKLRRELNVPIGLVNYAVGGTPIEAHLSPEVMASDSVLKPLLNEWWKNKDYPQWCRERAALNLTHWLADPKLKAKAPPHPFAPHYLWDAGIARYLPLPVKGVIWYQGESNATVDGAGGAPVDAALNKRKFKSLVKSWRQAWNAPELPVYYVQLPGLNRQWPEFREMQLQASREIKHVGMAVTIDVGHPTNVHPGDKKPVGERLARLALAGAYGKDLVANGPLYRRSVVKGSKVILDFEHGQGMKPSDGGRIRGFELAGKDRIFHPAQANVQGAYLTLTSAAVRKPASLRYAWANNPDCNLVNAEGLPASPFRTQLGGGDQSSGTMNTNGSKRAADTAAKQKAAVIRVACIGDSITFGAGIANREENSYPAQLQQLLGDQYEVRNFGNSGRGILKKSKRGKGKRAYLFMPEHAQALKFRPDIVICNLGINDIMDWGRYGKAEFVPNYRELIQAYKQLDSHPRVIIWHKLAPLFKGQRYFGDARVDAINAAIAQVAKAEHVETIDMSTPFEGKGALFPDHIHPNADGAKVIAEQTAARLKQE
ncbi:hypothetical protein HW115_17725 [Verrucomicrobiaceae bacterium N1E253]|uniref:Sialate O-acetylesterase n=1 Tax=Oceaniferula marina TaxID=2748318 RepID=A0A851GNP1_9BACT|nr:GDSL-type esterase/lipase family protein [Oceaniferula marina]NWK57461.1 hypothetical protein [Oceaniferula marina]